MNTTFSLLFYLKKPKNQVVGPITIYARITINSQRTEFSTGLKCHPNQWNQLAGKPIGNNEDAKMLGRYLDTINRKVHEAHRYMIDHDELITAESLKNKYSGKEVKLFSLIKVFEDHNSKMESLLGDEYAPGTLQRYKTSLMHTVDFLNWKFNVSDIDIRKVDHSFITEFEFYLRTVRKCANNSAVKYIKNFGKIIRICLANGWIEKNPFVNYKSKIKEVERVFLTEEELTTITEKKFVSFRLTQVRDIFLFSCYTGLAYADVQKLDRSQVVKGIDGENWISTNRQKTDTRSSIPILPLAQEILDRYVDNPQCLNKNKLLPILSNHMSNSYRYDQLNRIKRSWSYKNIDTTNNTWQNTNASKGLYRNTFTYDANGNIQMQVRRDSVGGLMDSLSYKYQRKSNGKLVRNRLYNVNDYVTGTPAYLNDITDQGLFDTTNINSTNNYGYDEIGNLVRDNAEQIQNIEWTLSGKIKTITRNIGSSKRNMSFEYDASGNRIAKHVYTSSNNWINSTYYLRDAQGNVMGVYEKTPGLSQGSLSYKLNEAHIYGSSRLGIAHPNLEMIGAVSLAGDTTKYYLGNKTYELSNHLGNVLATISDKKIALDNNNNKIVDGYVTDLVSASDYYPFGSPMPGRQYNNGSYRYGFNGKENDNEVKGTGNSVDFGARIYDPRLGRWLSLDPLMAKYPFVSPYNYVNNNPIIFIDKDGREWVNGYTAKVEELEQTLIKSPNDKSIVRKLNEAKANEALVGQYLKNLKTNDEDLYNYIDKLQVKSDGKLKNIKVNVTLDVRAQGAAGQTAETGYSKSSDAPNVEYNGEQIIAPRRSDKPIEGGFDVKIYGEKSFGDERLANEAGDIMYYMEYNKDAVKEKSSKEIFSENKSGGMDAYLQSGAGTYSNRVESTYRERKNNPSSEKSKTNPYPLKKK
jgi:RHS repeat-associated protein